MCTKSLIYFFLYSYGTLLGTDEVMLCYRLYGGIERIIRRGLSHREAYGMNRKRYRKGHRQAAPQHSHNVTCRMKTNA